MSSMEDAFEVYARLWVLIIPTDVLRIDQLLLISLFPLNQRV